MRLTLVTLRSELVSGTLDHLMLRVIVVDQSGSEIWHNRGAEEIASDPEVLTFAGPRLVGRGPSNTQAVRELICRANRGCFQSKENIQSPCCWLRHP